MAWTYTRESRDTGWSQGEVQLSWVNSWTVTELPPVRAGTIRLRLRLSTSAYWTYPASYQGFAEDSVSCGNESVSIQSRTGAGYSYDRELELPASWAGQTLRFRIAWAEQDLLCGASPGIPSGLSAGDGAFGHPLPIDILPQSSGLRHTVTASCLGRSETLLNKGAALSLSWTPDPAVYGALLPNGKSAQAVLICDSYYGDELLGSSSRSVTLSFLAQDAAPVPAQGWVTVSPYNTGAAASFDCYIAGISRATAVFDGSRVTTRFGASVSSFRLDREGESVTAAPWRTGVLAGPVSLLCTVTDSRGFSASGTVEINPLPYAPPAVSAVEVFRCDGSGNRDEDGAYLSVSAAGSVSALGGRNSLSAFTAATRQTGGGWSAEQSLTGGTPRILSGFDPDKSCQVRISAGDLLGSSTVVARSVSTRKWAMKFRADGSGAAFGKAPESSQALELADGWSLLLGDGNGNRPALDPATLLRLTAAPEQTALSCSYGELKLSAWYRLCALELKDPAGLTANTWVSLATLPAAYRPCFRVQRSLLDRNGEYGILDLQTDGSLRLYLYGTTGLDCRVAVHYFRN